MMPNKEKADALKEYVTRSRRENEAVILGSKEADLLNEYHPGWSDEGRSVPLDTKPTGIDATLAQRGNKYGEFVDHARITQNIQAAMRDSRNWATLPADMKEALEMTAHKIGRILNGDPTFHDSWHDIIGYIRLVEKTLTPEQHAKVE